MEKENQDDPRSRCGSAAPARQDLRDETPTSGVRPLFIPLRSEFFEAFESGVKREELRRYGPRWNERTCPIGRAVVLSRGYGKSSRLSGRIWQFKKQHGTIFGSTYKASIEAIYGTLDIDIACISIEVER